MISKYIHFRFWPLLKFSKIILTEPYLIDECISVFREDIIQAGQFSFLEYSHI